jgi:hypothetical protein
MCPSDEPGLRQAVCLTLHGNGNDERIRTMSEALSRAHSLVGFNPDGRPDNDFYPTPPEMTEPILKVEKFGGDIWEPACGDGAMAKVFEAHGHKVIGTDVQPRGYGSWLDFFMCADLLAPNIVTNPPYRLLNDFIERAAMFQPEKFAFLSKLNALETIERSRILERTKLTRVWVFRARHSIYRNGTPESDNGGMIAFCWLVWERGYTGKPVVGWI